MLLCSISQSQIFKISKLYYSYIFLFMQVDSTNFQQLLPEIVNRIKQSDFVAFDCEFTGLVTQLERIQGMFSNHVEFYERIKETALNFRIIQLGLAAFIFKEGIYYPFVYNFYVTPSTFTPGFNNVMVCQIQSLEFLVKNKLDFSRVFSKGIKSRRLYSNQKQEKHQYNQFPITTCENMFLSPEEEAYAQSIENGVLKEIFGNQKVERVIDFKNKALFAYFRLKYTSLLFDKGKKNLKLFEYIVWQRPQIQKQQRFSHNSAKIQQEVKIVEKSQSTISETIEKEKGQQSKIEQSMIQIQQPKAQQPACLAKIFQLLVAEKKPLVGHFPNLDIGLIYQNYIADLPDTYEEFCYNLNHCFPYLFDTKVLSRRIQSRLKGLKVDLPSLFKACSNPKLLKPYSNFSINGLEQYVEKQHEAGYDAFITGCSFIGMANYLSNTCHRVNYKGISQQNMLLYSRYCGQVSMNGNYYCSNAVNYQKTIIILPYMKSKQPKWRQIAKQLSKFGTLGVYEDHGQVYYVYEQEKNIEEIITLYPTLGLKFYHQRNIFRARKMYQELN